MKNLLRKILFSITIFLGLIMASCHKTDEPGHPVTTVWTFVNNTDKAVEARSLDKTVFKLAHTAHIPKRK